MWLVNIGPIIVISEYTIILNQVYKLILDNSNYITYIVHTITVAL